MAEVKAANNEQVSNFDKMKVTAKGLSLLIKLALKGKPLKITRAVIGDGIPAVDPVMLTELVHEIPSHQTGEEGTSATIDIQYYAPKDNETSIAMRLLVQNGDTQFTLREIGIMADDPDEGEILYAYTVDRTGDADVFGKYTGGVHISDTITAVYYVANAQNVTVNVTLNPEVTLPEFLAHKMAAELDHPDGAVTSRKIADNAITQSKLSNDSVSQSKIIDGAVTKNKIGDGAVTLEKLAPEVSEAWEKRDAEIVITIFSLFGGIRISYETWTDPDSPGNRTRIISAEYTTDTLTKLLPEIKIESSAQRGTFTTEKPGVYADRQDASFIVGIYDTFHSGESHLMKKPITDIVGEGVKTIVIGSEE